MRTRVGSWATPVTQVLPYLLVALVVITSLLFATAGDSLLASYDGIREAFARGRVVSGVAGLLQVLLLVIAVVGVALTFALAARRLGAIAWRWSEGKPILRAGLSSARFGLAIVAVAAVGVALFTWLPSGDRATTDGGTLSEALERAGNQVATLLGADSDSASAEEADSEASEPGLIESLVQSVLPSRPSEEERIDASESSSKSSQGPSSTKEQDNDETARPGKRTNDTAEPDLVTLAPRGPVPTVTEAPSVSSEEPASAPTASPIAEEPAVEEPVAEEPAAEEPSVTEELPPVTEEPPPVTEEPPSTGPPITEPPETPPDPPPKPPPEEVTPDAPPGTPKTPPINCTTSPGEEPGTTSTHCTI